MTIRISQPLAQVRLELVVDDKGKNFVRASLQTSLPRLESAVNVEALTEAMAQGPEGSFTYPECDEAKIEATFEGNDLSRAAEEIFKEFSAQAKKMHESIFACIKARADEAEALYLTEQREALREKYSRKLFGFFGPIVTPSLVPEASKGNKK